MAKIRHLHTAQRTEQQAAAAVAQARMLDPTRFTMLCRHPGYWRGAAKVREDMADLCTKADDMVSDDALRHIRIAGEYLAEADRLSNRT
ncbi:MAG: hypothetical protein E6Q98_15845 [Rhodospirillaceae bacterium]|nr:MAG: hypothetical protein E6Q98_15845 [Rhodospirillaceae bacterium]